MTLTASPPHCDARATGRTVTDWGFESLPCMTSVGLRSFTDREGIARRYCSVPEHKANVERRFGVRIYEGMDDDWDDRKARIDAAILADPERPS